MFQLKPNIKKNTELAVKYRDQLLVLREIQQRQYVSSVQGNADVMGLLMQQGVACIHLITTRQGRMLGSRAYFPVMPEGTGLEEVAVSFILQHYVGRRNRDIPKEIILGIQVTDAPLLGSVLSEQAKYKVEIRSEVRGERKKWLEMAETNAKQSLTSYLVSRSNLYERFSALKEALHLIDIPMRIECFDVSHTMGEATVASCVVFDRNGPFKSDYRRFNISGITAGDDVAAMKQALFRRYKRAAVDARKLPDVLLIDGGKAQVSAAHIVLKELGIHEGIMLVGVAKGITRKPGWETLIMPHQDPLKLSSDSSALHLIQQVRDEAHRFAITGHRQRRDKKRHVSVLEAIPGVGVKRRRELLRYFGGIQAINHASLDEIAKVPGINRSLAKRIFERLHDVLV